MTKYYTVDKLCKLTLVSVRTLHYYDEINLLKPSHRTAKGHRLYAKEDMLRLQQIVTFRFLGFTLSQIRLILQQEQTNMLNLVRLQASAIAEEAARIANVQKIFDFVITQFDLHQSVDWPSVAKIIEIFKQKDIDNQQWFNQCLSNTELQKFQKYAKTRTNKWMDLFHEVRRQLHTDPQGKIGIALVKKWIALADEAYGDHPELRNKLWAAYKSGLIPNDFFPHDKNVIAYLSQAFEKVSGGK